MGIVWWLIASGIVAFGVVCYELGIEVGRAKERHSLVNPQMRRPR